MSCLEDVLGPMVAQNFVGVAKQWVAQLEIHTTREKDQAQYCLKGQKPNTGHPRDPEEKQTQLSKKKVNIMIPNNILL